MIVGNSTIDYDKLKKIYYSPDKVREYAESLIPQEFRHRREIMDNQLYVVCMSLRRLGISDYETINKTIGTLLVGVAITGYTDILVGVDSLYDVVNVDKVKLYQERL